MCTMIKAYWWNENANFGDQLSPLILRYFGYQPTGVAAEQSDVAVCGSILQHLPSSYRGAVIGAGFVAGGAPYPLPHANILAVRGPLSLGRLQSRSRPLLADPGLLASRMFEKRAAPTYALGIVPHYVDASSPQPGMLRERFGDAAIVIDVTAPPDVVASQISSCEVILSSSLHGLVVADSYSIPNAWAVITAKVIGHGYKFHDYNAAFHVKQPPMFITGDERPSEILASAIKKDIDVKGVQDSLVTAFRHLAVTPA